MMTGIREYYVIILSSANETKREEEEGWDEKPAKAEKY